jgi:hypothetical protein
MRFRAACVVHPHGRVLGDAENVDPAIRDFHDEHDVEAAQPDGVKMEEVGGQQPGRMCFEEGAPLGVCPARHGPQACGGQDPADRAGADVVSETGELALDAAVSPAQVLARQADDKLAELLVDAGATRPVRVGPFLGDQASVPGQQDGRAGPSCRRSTVTSCRSVSVSAISALLR